MADELLNGRPAEDFEAAAIEHGRQCERERDAEIVAGLTAEDEPARRPEGVPLARQAPELKARKRRVADLNLDVLS